MLEQTRLSYLEAMGVTNWVPRAVLPNAARRARPNVPPPALEGAAGATAVAQRISSAGASPALERMPRSTRIPASLPRPATTKTPAAEANESASASVSPASLTVAAPSVRPFYMQLWLAGPCALLIETAEPGLEGSVGLRLLNEMLRAASLPTPARLYADFHWPLARNRQLDSSALAASQGLQAFMQARLESQPISSVGCFGASTVLLSDPNADPIEVLAGRVESIEQLPPVWFSPSLDALMAAPEEKRRLWHFLKRIKSQWTN